MYFYLHVYFMHVHEFLSQKYLTFHVFHPHAYAERREATFQLAVNKIKEGEMNKRVIINTECCLHC